MQHVHTRTLTLAAVLTLVLQAAEATSTPNILLILVDDLGYGDLGCYGNTTLKTPHLDKLASQGVRLTHNLAAYSMCTPSRAAFLTGRHPARYGMLPFGFPPVFLWTASAGGLPTSEITIGEVAKKAGYRTAFLGKWHQGWSVDRSDPHHHHPLNQGFDYFYGIPLTNIVDFGDDGSKLYKAVNPNMGIQFLVTFTLALATVTWLVRQGYVYKWAGCVVLTLLGGAMGYCYFCFVNMKLLNSFMFRNYDLVEQPIHLASVTRKLVAESGDWLQARHQDHAPFLLLISWLHVHTALATGPAFTGRSAHGQYGDAVEEMDWGVGQVMDMLDRYGMTHNTFIDFTSDHGGDPNEKQSSTGQVVGGNNGIFWGSKGDGGTEGGIRAASIIRWPAGGVAAGGVIHEPVSLMDVMPTVASLLNVSDVAAGHVMDGISLLPLLTGKETVSPHEFFFHYCQNSVHAVRYRPRTGDTVWKLALREPDRNDTSPMMSRCKAARNLDTPRLYDLTSDPAATSPVDPEQHSEVTSKMLKALQDHRQSLEPVPSQFALHRLLWIPRNQPCCNFPKCVCEDEKFSGMFEDS